MELKLKSGLRLDSELWASIGRNELINIYDFPVIFLTKSFYSEKKQLDRELESLVIFLVCFLIVYRSLKNAPPALSNFNSLCSIEQSWYKKVPNNFSNYISFR